MLIRRRYLNRKEKSMPNQQSSEGGAYHHAEAKNDINVLYNKRAKEWRNSVFNRNRSTLQVLAR